MAPLNRKQKLQIELKKIIEQEAIAFKKKHLPAMRKKYAGKYFKYLNSWGGDKEKWFYYIFVDKITDVSDLGVGEAAPWGRGWSFEQMPNGDVEIKIDNHISCSTYFLQEEISKQEFYAAWNEVMKNIDRLPG